MNSCTVEDCNEKHFAKGFCQKHYNQMRYHGKIQKRIITDPNEFIIESDIIRIKLYNNQCIEVAEVLCDSKHEIELRKYKWSFDAQWGYVVTSFYGEDGNKYKGFLHHLILQLMGKVIGADEKPDHIDRNTLNNLESNLRVCSNSQNNINQGLRKDNTSGGKGVILLKKYKKWRARININHERINLGNFDTKEEAMKAYNDAAIKYHGEFAVLNEIPEVEKINE